MWLGKAIFWFAAAAAGGSCCLIQQVIFVTNILFRTFLSFLFRFARRTYENDPTNIFIAHSFFLHANLFSLLVKDGIGPARLVRTGAVHKSIHRMQLDFCTAYSAHRPSSADPLKICHVWVSFCCRALRSPRGASNSSIHKSKHCLTSGDAH